jgi:hypothetical protein
MSERNLASGLAVFAMATLLSSAVFADPQTAELRVAAPQGTHVRIDGESLGRTPLEPIFLGAGRYRVTVSLKSGHEGRTWVDLASGSTSRVVVRLNDKLPRRPMTGRTGQR